MNVRNKDITYLKIAKNIGDELSTCRKAKGTGVGAIIIDKDGFPVSWGYAGSVSGHEHCNDVGHLLNDQGRCIRTVHAETNAIVNAQDRTRLIGATLYCTHEPCENCTKLIAQVGITTVVYATQYINKWNHHFNGGLKWVHIPLEPLKQTVENGTTEPTNDKFLPQQTKTI